MEWLLITTICLNFIYKILNLYDYSVFEKRILKIVVMEYTNCNLFKIFRKSKLLENNIRVLKYETTYIILY